NLLGGWGRSWPPLIQPLATRMIGQRCPGRDAHRGIAARESLLNSWSKARLCPSHRIFDSCAARGITAKYTYDIDFHSRASQAPFSARACAGAAAGLCADAQQYQPLANRENGGLLWRATG